MDIGTRMKTFYEEASKTKLMKCTPVVIRIDGRAFHTFTKGFNKPFDSTLMTAMQATMMHLCENIQGCVLGYTQSDEITLILIDYQKLNSSAWFDYEVQKLCSISASMATMAFNRYFREIATAKYERDKKFWAHDKWLAYSEQLYQTYSKVFDTAMFDARCFNIPKEEVTNLLYWRQLDATRNSIESAAHYYFKQSALQNKSQADILYMLNTQKDIDWHDMYTISERKGSCCIKAENGKWYIDEEIPVFKDENREYIEHLIYINKQ